MPKKRIKMQQKVNFKANKNPKNKHLQKISHKVEFKNIYRLSLQSVKALLKLVMSNSRMKN